MERKKFSKLDDWTVEILIDSLSENPGKKEKVIIPKFQRNLVWSKNQKKSFIDSIKSGFPFGSLLLFKEGSDEEGNTQYSLIDGLQRTTTIKEYVEKPTNFFSEENIEEEFLINIMQILGLDEKNRESLIKNIINWIKELKGFNESDGYSSYDLAANICGYFNIDPHDINFDKLRNIIVPFKEKIEKEADISNIDIPVIIYSGPESNLPTIFERINSRGTQLNKYQIYAATWSRSNMKINNTEIIDFIKAKYDSLIDEGLLINNYEPNSSDFYKSDFNVFEYVFGLGKYLSKYYPYLFGEYDSSDSTESIGFNLCTICLKDSIKKMPSLPESLLDIDQDKFFDALIDSTSMVFSILKPFITLKANKRTSRKSDKITIYHTEYQIVSLIAKIFKSKYDTEMNVRSSWSDKKNLLLDNMPYHYLYDIIREYWRGSGDSKVNKLVEGDRYEKTIYQENWDNILKEWFSYQLDRNEKSRVTIRQSDLLFLKYIYCHLMSSYQDLSNIEFEIEHIVPISRLKDIVEEEGIPMSAVSNLCLIEKSVNRSKKDLTIYEYFDMQISEGELTDEQAKNQIKQIEKFSFTKKDDLNFVRDLNITDYKNMIEKRFNKLTQIFYRENNISKEE